MLKALKKWFKRVSQSDWHTSRIRKEVEQTIKKCEVMLDNFIV